jgi:hypothetical protein
MKACSSVSQRGVGTVDDYSNPTPKPYTKEPHQQLKRFEFVSEEEPYQHVRLRGRWCDGAVPNVGHL